MNLGLIQVPSQYDPSMNDIQPEVSQAVLAIQKWADAQGIESFEIGSLCSRDHAHKLREIVKLLTE